VQTALNGNNNLPWHKNQNKHIEIQQYIDLLNNGMAKRWQ
jgi:hypothetical protein